MSDAVVTVHAAFDQEANLWYVESSDLHGVNAEAPTLDALVAKLPDVIFDLLDEGDAAATSRLLWYRGTMNYTSSEKPVPESIAASLTRSEAQIAAGQTVPLEPVLDRLRASIARMQADEKPRPPSRTDDRA